MLILGIKVLFLFFEIENEHKTKKVLYFQKLEIDSVIL